MKPLFHKIWAGYESAMTHVGRDRARRQLLLMSDRSLADAGFSRELLESGIAAWPWRSDTVGDALTAATCAQHARRAAVSPAPSELEARRDAELADLDTARADSDRADSTVVHEGGGNRWAA